MHWNDVQRLLEHLKSSGTRMKALFGLGAKLDELHEEEGPTDLDRVRGCLLGLAIGDAMGAAPEFTQSFDGIRQKWGYIEELLPWGSHKPGCWTDDTEMTIYLTRALAAAEDLLDLDSVQAEVCKQWVAWYKEHDGSRAPGNSCLRGSGNLSRGIDWKQSGKPNGNGCGTVMRVAPVGLVYAGRNEALKQVAWNQGYATHQGDRTNQAAWLCAHMIGRLMRGDDWEEVVEEIRELASNDLSDMVELALDPEVDIETKLDKLRGWDGGEAFAASLACFVAHPHDYEAAVRRAVNSPGDSDSLGCITGALVGVHLGIDAVPERWQEQVEEREQLEDLAASLAVMHEGIAPA